VRGVEHGYQEARRGAEIALPALIKPVWRYLTPTFLLLILVTFVLKNAFGWNLSFTAAEFTPSGYITDLVGTNPNNVARLAVMFIILLGAYTALLIHLAGERWAKRDRPAKTTLAP